MKKLLLVVLVGMVLAMNLYGLVIDIISEKEVDKGYTVVYME